MLRDTLFDDDDSSEPDLPELPSVLEAEDVEKTATVVPPVGLSAAGVNSTAARNPRSTLPDLDALWDDGHESSSAGGGSADGRRLFDEALPHTDPPTSLPPPPPPPPATAVTNLGQEVVLDCHYLQQELEQERQVVKCM